MVLVSGPLSVGWLYDTSQVPIRTNRVSSSVLFLGHIDFPILFICLKKLNLFCHILSSSFDCTLKTITSVLQIGSHSVLTLRVCCSIHTQSCECELSKNDKLSQNEKIRRFSHLNRFPSKFGKKKRDVFCDFRV